MKDTLIFQTFFQNFSDSLPPQLQSLKEEIKEHLLHTVKTTLENLEFIPRQEFDIQVEVLNRTRQKLKVLEDRLKLLETAKLNK